MNLYPIPSDFIYSITSLSWCDIKWGYECKFITQSIPIKKAEDTVLTGIYTTAELELSFQPPDCSDVIPFLKELCPICELDDESMIKRKWLFITLSWLWDNRNNFNEPLAQVENIYADFSYPSEIESFVRYMPVTDGHNSLAHTKEENINHLINHWKKYLDRSSLIFKS
ncbi:DUF2247 family protein [Klebsiella sp. BIGb0407]|uniref:DUF2247 family protein n=1 Tax=Klebsiella sp. BIGb0407 TaxID=2940603 RepID=UPI00216A1047|nr:DUF2247 family protein [Klebsiella sp. BIGb0407]MCS3430447.1 hypothetical protein [Klebsiella sp. BIGb0407]